MLKKRPNERHRLFVKNLFEHKFNATEAYLQTYPRVKDRDVAKRAASRLLTYVDVQEEIARRHAEINEKDPDTVGQIREALKVIAFTPITQFLSFGPGYVTLKNSKDISPELLLAVARVKETITKDGGSVSFELHSKEKALELLMRYHSLIIDKKEITGKDEGPVDGRITYFPPEPESIEEWLQMCEKVDAHMSQKRVKTAGFL